MLDQIHLLGSLLAFRMRDGRGETAGEEAPQKPFSQQAGVKAASAEGGTVGTREVGRCPRD